MDPIYPGAGRRYARRNSKQSKQTRHFISVAKGWRAVVRKDKRLSPESKFLLFEVFCQHPTFQPRAAWLRKVLGRTNKTCGQDRYQRIMREIVDAGYATRYLEQDALGVLCGSGYNFVCHPKDASERNPEDVNFEAPGQANGAVAPEQEKRNRRFSGQVHEIPIHLPKPTKTAPMGEVRMRSLTDEEHEAMLEGERDTYSCWNDCSSGE